MNARTPLTPKHVLAESRLRRLADRLEGQRLSRAEALLIAAFIRPEDRINLLRNLYEGRDARKPQHTI